MLSELFDAMENVRNMKANFTGAVGEIAIHQVAMTYLDDNYHVLTDIVLKAQNGTTQIDQIIVSKFGIFVVEVKNYKGWIFGNEKDAQWTQALTSGKYRFQNPLRQNYKHVKSLQSLLNNPDNFFKSMIVFLEADFKTEFPENVVNTGTDYFNFIQKHQTVLLSDDEVKIIVDKIISHRLSNEEHQAHIVKIKEQYNNADENNAPQCPRCSNAMVLRTAKSGSNLGNQFWGCSRYPQCKSIINISNEQEKKQEKIKQIEDVLKLMGF